MARALWLPAVLRSAGLTVHEQTGWRERGSSTFDPYGIICHATAGRLSIQSDIRVLLQGSTTAPPPISQLFLARTGEWWVIASGRCNHARTGRAGNMAGYGNTNLIGIEAANDNKGEPWPDVQYRSYVRGVAAICDYVDVGASKRRWTTNRVSGHKEHQPGEKTDPTFSMPKFRSDVAALLAGDTPSTPTPQGDDDDMKGICANVTGKKTVFWGTGLHGHTRALTKPESLAGRLHAGDVRQNYDEPEALVEALGWMPGDEDGSKTLRDVRGAA